MILTPGGPAAVRASEISPITQERTGRPIFSESNAAIAVGNPRCLEEPPTATLRIEEPGADSEAVKWFRSKPSRLLVRGVGMILMFPMMLAGTVVIGPSLSSAAPAWPGAHWSTLSPAVSPSPRSGPAMAYDPATAQMILYGGQCPGGTGEGNCSDTWDWTGTTWTQLFPPTSPGALYGSLAYDAATRQLVLFGFYTGGVWSTWVWSGTTWTDVPPTSGHPEPVGGKTVYDQATDQLLLFGAGVQTSTTSYGNQTWVWSGTDWTQLFPATSPQDRIGESMTFDPATNQLLLFGGVYRNLPAFASYADTWSWNGSNWSKLSVQSGPAARNFAQMAYDPTLKRVILEGGSTAPQTFGSFFSDAWVWDGSSWSELSGSNGPSVAMAGMDYDPRTASMVLFGGESHTSAGWGNLGATWTFLKDPPGYSLVDSAGIVSSFNAPSFGSLSSRNLVSPIVGDAAAPADSGYWLAAANGGVYAFGPGTRYHGGASNLSLDEPIVGMAADAATGGYWLVARDGGVLSYDAPFFGSKGGQPLNAPVVGMAPTPDGRGYWLVASDGGVFAFGDAAFDGSMGGKHLNQCVLGIAASSDGHGYWLVASDGGVFAFGDAGFYGSEAASNLGAPIVGISASQGTSGYWLISSNGTVYPKGGAPSYGGTTGSSSPTVGIMAAQ
jgi:hypothetical protein